MNTDSLIRLGCAPVLMAASVQVLVRVVPRPLGEAPGGIPGALASEWRRPRPLTVLVCSLTAAFAGWQLARPELLDQLARHADTWSSGRWWQFGTQLLVQDPWWQTPINLIALLLVGPTVERLFGPGRWLLLYLGGAAAGEAVARFWQPDGAGNSIAVLGLLGGLFGWVLRRFPGPALVARTMAALGVAAGAVLALVRDIHGPALLAGVVLGVLAAPRRPVADRHRPAVG
ncbi:rhomboid family intramembrane serine protease [Micromonospora sp. NPDC050980]|uniref:rhomboid family intramembrane serine protease n=1 Tax=Micromonospora sp. NPDC050980 TaxID=3155161 RepID=UPI00340F85A8